jgi:hypothetical protein
LLTPFSSCCQIAELDVCLSRLFRNRDTSLGSGRGRKASHRHVASSEILNSQKRISIGVSMGI